MVMPFDLTHLVHSLHTRLCCILSRMALSSSTSPWAEENELKTKLTSPAAWGPEAGGVGKGLWRAWPWGRLLTSEREPLGVVGSRTEGEDVDRGRLSILVETLWGLGNQKTGSAAEGLLKCVCASRGISPLWGL